MIVFDLDEAVRRCYGELRMFQKMAAYLFDEADPLIERMRTALNDSNATDLASTAHRLKGTVVYLGAPSAADATQRVEQIGMSGDLTGAGTAIDDLAIEIGRLKEAMAPHRAV